MEQDRNETRVLFTKEELAEKVRVPAVVERDLKRIISDRLEQCGMYYRVFSRTKTAQSMARKFDQKAYNQERKLQDLVGVRINLYFDDDVSICRSIVERTFEVIEWSTSQRNEDEFKPTKLNGVFRLPEYLRAEISPATWEMCIDDTFEVQIKTVFFEGWHEIEHDMRYKGEELWLAYPSFSRYFNSILATLELCDKSMVRLFEDVGHELYKSGKWSDMIRSHFRLKMSDVRLYPEVERILEEDQEKTVDSLAKRIYKTPRAALIDQLLKRIRRVPINVNTIIALLNDAYLHDGRLTEVFREQDVYNDGREEGLPVSRSDSLLPLERNPVFQVRTWVDGSRMRAAGEPGPAQIFELSSGYLYGWIRAKYGELFNDLPAGVSSYRGERMGYRIHVEYDPARSIMQMETRHMDMEVGGRIWYSESWLRPDERGRIILSARNGYAEPASEHFSGESPGMFFSYPGYYKMITDNVGFYNGMNGNNRRRILHKEQIPTLSSALRDPRRTMPVVLVVSREGADGMMDESWLGQFRVSDFTRTVWRYAHVFTCYESVGREVPQTRLISRSGEWEAPRLFIFWPGSQVDSYGPEDVENCSFGRHLEARDDERTYDIVHGGQAFYHQLVTDLREYNVSVEVEIPPMGPAN